MTGLPFYFVPLTHDDWEMARAAARRLPEDALPELRLDLFPEAEPAELVRSLKGRCLVTCRRAAEYGQHTGTEQERVERLRAALEERPRWLDWEWDLEVPDWLEAHRMHVRLLRSVHVAPGVFDLHRRLENLPDGDAFKWVGHAESLVDNVPIRHALAWASDRHLPLSAFLMGPKGLVSRAMQRAWGGAFTYAAPDDGPPAAPGQLPLATMRAWRCHKFHRGHGLCAVLGSPVLHSRGPGYHNPRFQRAFKDLVYLPLDAATPQEASAALDGLEVLGASITAPLKESLPEALGLRGPLNTLWRRSPGDRWQGTNTDAEALEAALRELAPGPVLVLGSGGVAHTTLDVLQRLHRPALALNRRDPLPPEQLGHPVGVIQATSLGMAPEDPLPFPTHLEAVRPTLRWAVEWVYKEDTAFAAWAREAGLLLVEGAALFEAQAEAQSRRFVAECG